jgi:hypothetical protein
MVSAILQFPRPFISESLVDRYRRIRNLSFELVAPLAPEDQVVQTIPEVSPTKWHLAHVTWFFEQFCLSAHIDGYEPDDERYYFLFNTQADHIRPTYRSFFYPQDRWQFLGFRLARDC